MRYFVVYAPTFLYCGSPLAGLCLQWSGTGQWPLLQRPSGCPSNLQFPVCAFRIRMNRREIERHPEEMGLMKFKGNIFASVVNV